MIAPLRRVRHVSRRRDAGQVAKIVDEVSLIGVTVFRGERRPVRSVRWARETHGPQDALETLDSGKPLGSDSYLRRKPALECPGGDAQPGDDPRYGHPRLQCGDRILDGRSDCGREMAAEYLFEDLEFRYRCGGGQKFFAQQPPGAAPEVFELRDLIANRKHGHGEKVPGSSGAELDCGEPSELRCVDDHGLRVRSGEYGSRQGPPLLCAWAAISPELVFVEVHHQVGAGVGHDSFQGKWQVNLVIMERFDEWCQRAGTRLGGNVLHGGRIAR